MSEVNQKTKVEAAPARKKPGRKRDPRSRTSKARRMIMEGKLSPKQIATRVGMTTSHIYVLRSNMKAEGMAVPPVPDAVKTKPLPSGKSKPKPTTMPVPPAAPGEFRDVIAPIVVTAHVAKYEPPRVVKQERKKPTGPFRRFFDWMFSV